MRKRAREIDLMVITDRAKTRGRSLADVVASAIDGGARWFQLREKDMAVGKLTALAEELRALTAERGAHLIINDRADVALAVGADGVHLPARGLPPAVARRIVGEGMLVGVSTHSLAEARQAAEAGADYIFFGPLFYTPSKAAYGPPVGLEALQEVAAALGTSLPVIGLGGVKPGNVAEVLAHGARGVALISAVIAADDPAEAARGILSEMTEAAPARSGAAPTAPAIEFGTDRPAPIEWKKAGTISASGLITPRLITTSPVAMAAMVQPPPKRIIRRLPKRLVIRPQAMLASMYVAASGMKKNP